MPFPVIILYIVVMGAIFLFRLLPEVRVEAFNDSVIAIVCLIGAFNLFRTTRLFEKSDPARQSWMFFGIGLLSEGIGHVWYSSAEFIYGEVFSFPIIADYFIMAGAICYVYSLWNFNLQIGRIELFQSKTRKWIANSVFLVLVLLNFIFIIYPTLADPEEALWLRLLYIYYPVFDTLIAYFCLHMALSFLSLGQAPFAKPWYVLVLAFIIFLITDSAYAYLDLAGTYHPYLLINPGWGLAYLFVSYASYLQYRLMTQIKTIQIPDDFWNEDVEVESVFSAD